MLKIIKREKLLSEIRKLDEVNIYLKERHDELKCGGVEHIYLPLEDTGYLNNKNTKQLLMIRDGLIKANLSWVIEIRKLESK